MNRLVIDTVRRLRTAGHEVALVHARRGGQLEGTGYIYDAIDGNAPPAGNSALRLEAILEDFSPDVIQLHGVANTSLDAWLAARKPTLRFIHNHQFYCSGHGLTLERPAEPCLHAHGRACAARHYARGCGSWNPLVNYVRYRAVGQSLRALRGVHGLQVMSGTVRRQLIANGIPEGKITSLPPYAPSPTGARHEGYTSVRTVLHAGGLLGQKGVWMVVRMIRELPKDVQIVFAGGGAEKDMLESHVRRRGLGERVRIVGEATPEQWSLLYREATLVILPVLWNEPLGLEGLGAMAYGKPVVAFDTEGIREWLVDGDTGVSVPFGSRRAFRDAVRGLLEDRDRLHAMGRKARAVWEKKFRPENHLNALVANYENVQKEAQP